MSARLLKISSFVAAGLLISSPPLHAAVIPDAGSILREQNPQRELPRDLPSAGRDPVIESSTFDKNLRVTVKAFRFEGYEGIATESELQALVAGSIGKTLDSEGLRGIVGNVTARLKSKGWFLSRAYYPEQDLSSGIVTIAIVAGKSESGVLIERDSSTRIKNCVLKGYADHGARAGDALKKDDLERSVLLINDLPGMNVKAVIFPGSLPGSSGVKYAVSEASLLSGVVWVDNHGNRYTGKWRANAMVTLNDPLCYGDQLTVMFTGATGLSQGQISYQAPIGTNGLKARVSLSGMQYLLQEEFLNLDYRGESGVVDAGLSYPLIRSRKMSVTTGVTYSGKRLADRHSDIELSHRRVHSGTINLDAVNFDGWLGGGSTSGHVAMSHGDFHELNETAYQDAVTNGSEGRFTYFNTSVSRLQRISQRVTLDLSWRGQFACNNLNSSEQFYLGGPNGVRAYPVGEAGGDEGHLFNVNLRCRLPVSPSIGNMELSGFYDAGRITLNHDRYEEDVVSATGNNGYWLQGLGIGLNWVYGSTLVVRSSWAHTIGGNPGRSIHGTNTDGRKDNNQFWFQAMIYF